MVLASSNFSQVKSDPIKEGEIIRIQQLLDSFKRQPSNQRSDSMGRKVCVLVMPKDTNVR